MSPSGPGLLDGRVALVTGAGRGIGRAIARRLGDAGAFVVVNDIDEGPAEAVVAEICAAGGQAIARAVSVVDYDAVRATVQAIVEDKGHVDILVSNAGVATAGKSVLRTPRYEAERVMAVNAFAALVLCQEVIPAMRTRGRGDIVMISSTAAALLPANSATYNMAKTALEALAFTLAKEERRNGIRVNVVAPSITDTRLGREVKARVIQAAAGVAPTDDELASDMDAPGDVAEAVFAFVADPDANRSGCRHDMGQREPATD